MISPALVEKIFDAAIIEDVIGDFVNLKKQGADYKGLCPFHDDKSPSMSVSPSRRIYKCFSCGNAGNVAKFVMEHEGLSYPAALKYLADKYHIPFEQEELNIDAIEEEGRRKETVYNGLSFAGKTFFANLNETETGKNIYKTYLLERGIRENTIDTFKIGLSGLGKGEFLEIALKNGYSPQQLFDAGLVKKINEDGGVLEQNLRDTFVERIVFPIHNIAGNIVGFGGRIIKKDTKAPKYLNSPETIVYEKRKQLYGLFYSKNEIRKVNQALIVEGYMDVVSLFQMGIQNVVAASGTAFTDEQARLLKRFTQNTTLLFDGDVAGINAALKHIETLLQNDLNVNVVLFPEGEDPDSFAQKNGKAGFDTYLDTNTLNFVDFIFQVKMGKNLNDPIAKSNAARAIAQAIAVISDPLKRVAYISEAARVLDWDASVLTAETNKARNERNKQTEREEKLTKKNETPVILTNIPPEITPQTDSKNYQEYELLKTLILYGEQPYNSEQSVAQYIIAELLEEEMWPEDTKVKAIFDEAKKYLDAYGVPDHQFYITNEQANAFAADILSKKYVLSEAWLTDYEKVVKTEEDNYLKIVTENLNYLKMKKISEYIADNQEKIKTTSSEEELIIYLKLHEKLVQIKQELTTQHGIIIKN